MRARLVSGVLFVAAFTLPAQEILRKTAAMGTELTVRVVASDRTTALRASEAAIAAVAEAESRWSTWRADSELARLNRAPVGVAMPLGEELANGLAAVAPFVAMTDGAFDPVCGALVATWGLRTGGALPTADAVTAARAASGWRHLHLEGTTAIRSHAEARLDEGGFAKGLALDHALAAATAAGASSTLLDLGGQVAVAGTTHPVRLAHPCHRDRAVVEFELSAGSVATSGNSERGRIVAGQRVGHLLDPRTGSPAADFGCCVVVAPTALAADCLSTGLFVAGPERALAFAASQSDIDVVLLCKGDGDGPVRVFASARLHPRLRIVGDAELVPLPRGRRPTKDSKP